MCKVVQSVILTCHLLKPAACIYGGDSSFSFCSILIMQNQGFLHQEALFHSVGKINGQLQFGHPTKLRQLFTDRTIIHSCHLMALQSQTASAVVVVHEASQLKFSKIKSTMNENVDELSYDDDDELCPVECVREFKTDEEFSEIMEKAKESNALVVVDFYRTSCGSCKYIEQGFIKLCKGSGVEESPVVFLKHNVIDEYDEQSEVADRLRIRSVPLFHFYKNGVLLEAFATRDKVRILDAITKYTALSSSLQVDSVS